MAVVFSSFSNGMLRHAFRLTAILLAVLQAWANRNVLSATDGISYLDVGDAYFRGDWLQAINGYWSPFYSWELGLALSLIKPAAHLEFSVVKLVNLLNFLINLACFEFLLYQIKSWSKKPKFANELGAQSDNYPKFFELTWTIFGYTLFLWAALGWIGVYSDTPDMLTSALVYLATGLLLRIYNGSLNWYSFIGLGGVLGIAYLSKAVMFPLALVFIGISSFSTKKMKRSIPKVFAALLAFAIVSGPFITALSLEKGRFTFGETGKINYTWFVNPGSFVIPERHWQGEYPEYGTPKHPTRKLWENPEVYEFGSPVIGTYPPWTDPSYWYDGVQPKVNLSKQVQVLAKNILFYNQYFLGFLILTYLILAGVSGEFREAIQRLGRSWPLILIAAVGLFLYAIATDLPDLSFCTRYLAPFAVLLFVGFFTSLAGSSQLRAQKIIFSVTLIALIFFGGKVGHQVSKDFITSLKESEPTYLSMTNSLKSLGIQAGDKVALMNAPKLYWARLARVKVVSEISDSAEFWQKDKVVRDKILSLIQSTGAKALIEKRSANWTPPENAGNWKQLGTSDHYVRLLN